MSLLMAVVVAANKLLCHLHKLKRAAETTPFN
jgi:hypothetical protein